jgi:pimeloyl-ACP methyl ester carboxylesterase
MHALPLSLIIGAVAIGVFIIWRFSADIHQSRSRVGRGSTEVTTRCGPIEYQEAGSGVPLLAIHGSGGGFDQGMAFAGPLQYRGIRVIAMSRFGYLRTPMPADASIAAQADAHVCLLDALGIQTAAVLGGSAGAPSALQMAIRHPDRVSALILLAPLAYKPSTEAPSAAPMTAEIEKAVMAIIGSDFLFWLASHLFREGTIKTVLATPPNLLSAATLSERARIDAILRDILPVSARSAGLRSDTLMSKHLKPSALDTVRVPTLIIAARDDLYGTYASAEYTAGQIHGSKFVGFETGGHTWVGHNEEVMSAIADLVARPTLAGAAR